MPDRPRLFDNSWNPWFNKQQKGLDDLVKDQFSDLEVAIIGRFNRYTKQMYPNSPDIIKRGTLKTQSWKKF